MKPARRMGPPGSPVWHSMLDSTEAILREEGYGALTSRHVAERAGVKQRLVYYYFETMEHLIVGTFRRLASRELEQLDAALSGPIPLREIWKVCTQTNEARMVAEFIALANRIDALREEVVRYIEGARKIQERSLRMAMDKSGSDDGMAPVAIAILATSAVLTLHRESAIGVTTGHAEVMDVIGNFIEKWEKK